MARILIVDDENNIRLMMRLALQASGHEVETAADGAEGLDKFGAGTHWDLVLLDQRMPGLEGLQVLAAMRQRHHAAKIIMITAFGTIDLAAEAMQAGATDFLRKPFTMEVLLGTVQASLKAHGVEENATAAHTTTPLRAPLSLQATSINGYRIESPGEAPENGKGDTGGVTRYKFQVHQPGGEVRPCVIELPAAFKELVKTHTDSEKIAHGDQFWRWLSEESLANYLWQHAELPPNNFLQVTELTMGLRRWIDSVLVA
ncbi:MAG: response regulator [Abitibacteriaceae bacterium]|nr:response regulator [Abditibacteriaceae bacterium]MBV9867806.1 response regulator [Abditibacteriaceae bacterium]